MYIDHFQTIKYIKLIQMAQEIYYLNHNLIFIKNYGKPKIPKRQIITMEKGTNIKIPKDGI